MKSHVLLVALVALCVFFVSCSGGLSSGDDGKRDDDYNTGTGFLEIDFIRNAPPAEVYENTQSAAILKLSNNGATDIRQGFMSVSVDPSVLYLIDSNTAGFSLEGKKRDLPKGDEEVLTFNFLAKPLPQESQVRETRIVVTACYDYQTEVLEDVCIDTDPYDMRSELNEQVCELSDISPGGTGGPVTVSRIEPRFEQNGDILVPVFLITITHSAGNSDFIMESGNARAYCSDQSLDEARTNIVQVRAELSDIPLGCDKNRVELRNGRAQVTCRGLAIDGSFTGSYEAPLLILLDYGIAQAKTQQLRVIKGN